jgi:parallel beta-helix repeat protein
LPAAADTDNTIEDNEILGNANGIFLTAGVRGNTFRGNTIVGNPPVQVAVDHTVDGGFDIKNLADADANTFEGNICMTSVNAPCPSAGPSLTANPNPIRVAGNATIGATTINWNASQARHVEVHIGSPSGPLFVGAGNRGSAQTGLWVADGTTFYLQDVTDGKPLTSDYTLATLVVHLQRSSTASLDLPGGPRSWAFGASAILLGLALCGMVPVQYGSRRKRVRIPLSGAVLLAGVGLSLWQATALAQASQTALHSASSQASATADRLDQMIAAGASPTQLADYVFDTHGCKNCHTMGHDGKLGLTTKGKERAQGFEGCIRMLTAMTVIVQVPEDKRSPQQRQKAERFEEFGCMACHKLTTGKLALTEVGAKLAHLHLGCVDVEKLTSSRTSSQTDVRH